MPAVPDGIVTHKFAQHIQSIGLSAFLYCMHQNIFSYAESTAYRRKKGHKNNSGDTMYIKSY